MQNVFNVIRVLEDTFQDMLNLKLYACSRLHRVMVKTESYRKNVKYSAVCD